MVKATPIFVNAAEEKRGTIAHFILNALSNAETGLFIALEMVGYRPYSTSVAFL